MSTVFSPRLDILPDAQRRLWPELAQTPEDFTLYGGTAIALRLGHRQSADLTVDRGDPVQLSFFGGLGLGQVAPVGVAEGPRLKIAALIDLAGTKAAVVTQRAEPRDYLDIHALMTEANISLPEMLAAGTIIYGTQFSALLSLKAIAYHDDAALAELPKNVRHDLIEAVKATNPRRLPALGAVRRYEAKP
jgi:hypothetical protein